MVLENKKYVLDANVFLEYIYGRKFQDIARYIIAQAIVGEIEIIIPSLALDEITEVLCGNMKDINEIEIHLGYIEKLINESIIKVVVPTTKVRLHAIEMARYGNKKSGYPEFTDSLYHSLAIFNDAIFITNDKRHLSKVKKFGHIKLLADIST